MVVSFSAERGQLHSLYLELDERGHAYLPVHGQVKILQHPRRTDKTTALHYYRHCIVWRRRQCD